MSARGIWHQQLEMRMDALRCPARAMRRWMLLSGGGETPRGIGAGCCFRSPTSGLIRRADESLDAESIAVARAAFAALRGNGLIAVTHDR